MQHNIVWGGGVHNFEGKTVHHDSHRCAESIHKKISKFRQCAKNNVFSP